MARFQNLINKSFIIIVSILFEYSHGANILALFHTPSKSHLLLAQPLFFELVRTGHTVTVVSPFPEKNPPEGYIDVPIPEVIEFTKGKSFLNGLDLHNILLLSFFFISKHTHTHTQITGRQYLNM